MRDLSGQRRCSEFFHSGQFQMGRIPPTSGMSVAVIVRTVARWRPRTIWREFWRAICFRRRRLSREVIDEHKYYLRVKEGLFVLFRLRQGHTLTMSCTPVINERTVASSSSKSGCKRSTWTSSTESGRPSSKRQILSESASAPKRQLTPSTENILQSARRTSTSVSSSRSAETTGQLQSPNYISEDDVSTHITHGRPRDADAMNDEGIKASFGLLLMLQLLEIPLVIVSYWMDS